MWCLIDLAFIELRPCILEQKAMLFSYFKGIFVLKHAWEVNGKPFTGDF